MLRSLITGIILLTTSCSYQLVHTGKTTAKGIKTIHLPLAENHTLTPRAEVFATNALADALVLDGTLQLCSTKNADATLHAQVSRVQNDMLRSSRYDILRPEMLQNTVIIHWQLISNKNNRVLMEETTSGYSRFFVDSNMQTAEKNALPDAMARTATAIVSRITNSF